MKATIEIDIKKKSCSACPFCEGYDDGLDLEGSNYYCVPLNQKYIGHFVDIKNHLPDWCPLVFEEE